MLFRSSLDRTARRMTILVMALLLIVLGIQLQLARQLNGQFGVFLLLGFVAALVIFIPLSLRVTGLTITGDALLIHRRWNTKAIYRSDIEQAGALDEKNLGWSLRTFGVGGLFGYNGRFVNRRFGAMTWYLTRRDYTVLLRLKNGQKVLVSPDDRDGFLQALKAPPLAPGA